MDNNKFTDFDYKMMAEALKQAKKAAEEKEVPIGAIITLNGKIISKGRNSREKTSLSTAHAEINAINKACRKLGSWRLTDCNIYVTLEPCLMCAGAIYQSRISNLFFGAYDPKGGAAGSCTNVFETPGINHKVNVYSGLMNEDCAYELKKFFKLLRSS